MNQTVTAISVSNVKQQLGTQRYGAAGEIVNNKLTIFGGFSKQYHNETIQYGISTNLEETFAANPTTPPVRRGHSVTKLNETLYLFGGDSQGACQNDLYTFKNNNWEQILTPTSPPVRYGHCAAALNEKLFIFGGKNPQSKTLLEDLWCFNPESNQWTQLHPSNFIKPSPRYGAALSYLNTNQLILIGGVCQTGRLNDMWILQINQNTVEFSCLIENQSFPLLPSPRSEFVLLPIQQNQFLIYGGNDGQSAIGDVFVIDCQQKSAIRVNDLNQLPRYAAGFCKAFEKQFFKVTLKELENYQNMKYVKLQNQQLNIDTQNTLYNVIQLRYYIFCGTNQKYNYADLLAFDIFLIDQLNNSELMQSQFEKQIDQQNVQLQQKEELVQSQLQHLQQSQQKLEKDPDIAEDVLEFQQNVIGVLDHLNNKVHDLQDQQQEIYQQQQLFKNNVALKHEQNEQFVKQQILENENIKLRTRVDMLEGILLKLCLNSGVDFHQLSKEVQNGNTYKEDILSEMKKSEMSANSAYAPELNIQDVLNDQNEVSISKLEEVLNDLK